MRNLLHNHITHNIHIFFTYTNISSPANQLIASYLRIKKSTKKRIAAAGSPLDRQ